MPLTSGLIAHATRQLTGTTLTVEQATAHARGAATEPPPPPARTAAAAMHAGWIAAEGPTS